MTPLFEASDELWHYPMVKYIADNGFTLPVQNPENPGAMRQEGSQPPLYYMIGAALTFWIDTTDMDQVRLLNPHPDLGVIKPDGNVNIAMHDPTREAFPWKGAALAVHIVRFFSVILGAITVVMAYQLARELFPEREGVALGAAALTAFNPMFLFISGAINNDNLSTALASILLVQIVRLLKQTTAPTLRQLIGIGVVAGCGMLAKFNIGFMLPFVALALGILSLRLRDWRPLLIGGIITGGLTVLIGAWWYLRNWSIYGDPTGLNIFLKIVGSREIPANLAQLWSERHTFLMSYWGFFGGVNVPLPDAVYKVFNGIAAVGLVGLVLNVPARIANSPALKHRAKLKDGAPSAENNISLINSDPIEDSDYPTVEGTPSPSVSTTSLSLARRFSAGSSTIYIGSSTDWAGVTLGRVFTLIWIVVLFLSLIRWTQATWASQGRLMFAAIAPISLWLALGLLNLGKLIPRMRWRLLGYAAGWHLLMAALAIFLIARTYSDPSASLGIPSGKSAATLSLGTFAEYKDSPNQLRLGLCCDLPKTVQPGDYATFDVVFSTEQWKPSPKSWSAFIHLVNPDGLIVAQRDVLLRQGLWSTRLMDITAPLQWRNRFSIPIPEQARTPDTLHVQLGFYNNEQPTERMAIVSATEPINANDTTLALGSIRLEPREQAVNFGDEIDFLGYDVSSLTMKPGDQVTVTLKWRARRQLKANYSTFVHIFDFPTTRIFGGSDGMPSPTSTWQPGEIITDVHTFKVNADAPPGTWEIEIGLYEHVGDEFRRLRIITPDGGQAQNYLKLSRVRIDPK
jgi:4-amino-4-deoxy-L-arabinose transferase-like glycosyltransferase